MLKGLHHVSLKVASQEALQAAITFYRDLLGFPLLRTWGQGEKQMAMLDLGNTILELSANGVPGAQPGPFAHIAFCTDDVDGDVARVTGAGFSLIMAPTDVKLGEDHPARVAFCRGPAGEELEFFCEL